MNEHIQYLFNQLLFECTKGNFQPLTYEVFHYEIASRERLIEIVNANPQILVVRCINPGMANNYLDQFLKGLIVYNPTNVNRGRGPFLLFWYNP